MQKNEIIIFTDGSSLGNPGPGGWGVIIAFPHKELNKREIVELGGGEKITTNNRMEMNAVIEALSYVKDRYSVENSPSLVIYSDSNYLIKGITGWIYGWERNGWKKRDGEPVKNDDLWKRLKELTEGVDIEWKHLQSHTGIAGNERADEIAQGFACSKEVLLKKETFGSYGVDIFCLRSNPDMVKNKNSQKKSSNRKPYSYVSSIEGKALSHKNWQDCHKRVQGASRARFKKVYSQEEEMDLIDKWSY